MLQLDRVCKRFGDKLVADRLSLQLAKGEVLALLGPSGGGKSTMLKMIAGLEPVDGGRMLFDGQNLAAVPVEQRGFALMFQDFALFPHLDVLGNVCFGLRERGLARAAAQQQARTCLQQLGLADMETRKVWTLSGGEQQRVALARALVTQPQALLLDEPFSALDHDLRQHLRQELEAVLDKTGIPLLLISHDPQDVAMFGQQVARMVDGRIVGD